MTKKLRNSYKKYWKSKPEKTKVLSFLRRFMPEIIFRSTKLEGEAISRREVFSALANR